MCIFIQKYVHFYSHKKYAFLYFKYKQQIEQTCTVAQTLSAYSLNFKYNFKRFHVNKNELQVA